MSQITKEQVEASVKRCRQARILACSAWSDVMDGGTINAQKTREADKAEQELAAAIAELARFALSAVDGVSPSDGAVKREPGTAASGSPVRAAASLAPSEEQHDRSPISFI